MVGPMAGFSGYKTKRLVNKNDYTDSRGRVNYKKLVSELDRISGKIAKEVLILERI